MKKLCMVAVIVMATAGIAFAASVLFSWNANTEPDLAGYRLYLEEADGVYDPADALLVIPAPNTNVSLPGVPADGQTYCWVLTAFDTSGNESGPSEHACASIADTTPPDVPDGFGCTPQP